MRGPGLAAVVVLIALAAACAPSSPVGTQASTSSAPLATATAATESSRPSTASGLVLGGEQCVPSSPRIPSSGGIIGTVVGTTTANTQLFALMHPLIEVGMEYKIIVRMTGAGPLETYAQHVDGSRVTARLIDPHTLGSSFEAPGDEWGVFYTLPKAGCWQLHFTRSRGSGDIWFIASPKV